MARTRFRALRFHPPSSAVSFIALTNFRAENSLSEFLSAYYLCAIAISPSFSPNSPSLSQNAVTSLFRNSTLETLFSPLPIRPITKELLWNSNPSVEQFGVSDTPSQGPLRAPWGALPRALPEISHLFLRSMCSSYGPIHLLTPACSQNAFCRLQFLQETLITSTFSLAWHLMQITAQTWLAAAVYLNLVAS